MQEESYKGYIRIPNQVKCDARLSNLSKLLYGDILSLSSSKICYAGNKYFSNLYSCSTKTITRSIKQLSEFCYIEIINHNNSKRSIKPLILIENSSKTKMSRSWDNKVSHNKKSKKGFIDVDGEQIYV